MLGRLPIGLRLEKRVLVYLRVVGCWLLDLDSCEFIANALTYPSNNRDCPAIAKRLVARSIGGGFAAKLDIGETVRKASNARAVIGILATPHL